MSTIAMESQARLRYKLLNFSQSQLYGLFFGHFGKLSMIALYFILTQWLQGQHVLTTIFGQHIDFYLWDVKYVWDHLLSSDISHGGMMVPRNWTGE